MNKIKTKEKWRLFSDVVTGTTQNNQNNQTETHQINVNDPETSEKPIFLKDEDVHGSGETPRSLWLTNLEIYNAIGTKVPVECIKRYSTDKRNVAPLYGQRGGQTVFVSDRAKPAWQAGAPVLAKNLEILSIEAQTKEHISETTDKTFNTPILKPSQNSNISSKSSDTRTGSAKNVQLPSLSNTGNDKSQQSIDKFVRTPKNKRRTTARNHTPPTPTENIGPKKSKA
ncbi:unnamed protein product [Mytilus coruscus]|uniref:Uncharacterized protein n=1 Tax=Mytilus coruscus TaxID=42192 RepID=A0A6J8EKZ6_MYTCO|nr:unnamed protein product [Mytilus coruscus]